MSALEKGKKVNKSKTQLMDPLYAKLMKSVERAIGSTEFYEFFMDALSRADNEIQFSNRRVEKIIDLRWVETLESTMGAMQAIIASPRNIIREDELIVNVAHAKKGGSDVVRHLAQHGALVEDFDEETGEVRPSKLMQKFREDSEELYENRLAFTTIEMAYHFVESRYNAIFASLGDEYGAKLKLNTNLETATELLHFDMYMHIKEKESALEADEKNGDVLARIDRLHRLLTSFIMSPYGQAMSRLGRVRGNIVKTNVLKKNPSYRKLTDLYDFLRHYDDVGYALKITEQNPQVDEKFVQNLFHTTLIQYMVLKGYLENEDERKLPAPLKQRKRKLKPKVIKEIIEELTEDYDVPDVEVRKILIEELTKEQLMMEEESERLRLIEEQAKRKEESEEYRELLMEHEKEKIRQEHEAELERQRLEEEERKRQQRVKELELLREDERRRAIFQSELTFFSSKMLAQKENREDMMEAFEEIEPVQEYEEAAKVIEDEEIREYQKEALRRQNLEDQRRKSMYHKELKYFFTYYKESLNERNVEPEEHIEVEELNEYSGAAKVIEDIEIAERDLKEKIEFEKEQLILRQRIAAEQEAERKRMEAAREAERIRVLQEMERLEKDNTKTMPLRGELNSFQALLTVYRNQRIEVQQQWEQLQHAPENTPRRTSKGWRGLWQ